MVDLIIETFKRGEIKITGSYGLTPEGFLNYTQNSVVFKDKFGQLHCGKFKEIYHDTAEVNLFSALLIESNIGGSNENFNE